MDFPAKILLFGEYGILLNSKALSIPYPRFYGKFRFVDAFSGCLPEKEAESNDGLKRLLNYFKSGTGQFGYLHLDRFENEVNQGIYFDSSIPSGYGLGSSGALTAALYSRYAIHPDMDAMQQMKEHLASIESCFHGLSSGTDPLTSLLKKPVLMDNNLAQYTIANLSDFFKTYTLFLINTHTKGDTGGMVGHFMEECKNPRYLEKIEKEYLPLINQTIEAVLAADFEIFESLIEEYSVFQLSFFEKMIPADMRKYAEYGIETGEFHLKLCGSGGGGYMLAISRSRTKAEKYFNDNQLDYSIVNKAEIESVSY
jgi:mevalonate kinase